jgi:L-alanine-DL-glutamate epimerase-like enolase superfamily enzyme
VTGETPADCEAALRDVVVPLLLGEDPLRRAWLTERLADELVGRPAALAAVDQALHDLLGKVAGLPVWRVLGGYRSSIATSVTVFIVPVDEAVARSRALVAKGFDALKLKGGVDVDEDIERVQAVRAAVGEHVDLRFDANQGYTAEQAIRFFVATRQVGLRLFEQPTPASELSAMREVVSRVAAPVMADESVMSLADAFAFARDDAMDMVNLKLQKVGGIDAGQLINGVARSAGLEVMVGCMDEAELSIAAGLAFALSRRNVELADLDGHLDFLDDPTAGCVRLVDGVLHPSDEPGFGRVDL